MELVALAIYVVFCYLLADKVGRHRKIGFAWSFVLGIVASPFIAYWIVEGSGLKNPRGCSWCGNKENEAEYCGLCGKNEAGEVREVSFRKPKLKRSIRD